MSEGTGPSPKQVKAARPAALPSSPRHRRSSAFLCIEGGIASPEGGSGKRLSMKSSHSSKLDKVSTG
jgi:hypothetical protein